MVKTAGLILFLFTLTACSDGMYDMLHRSIEDPKIVKPNVESFVESNTIFISWDYDAGADEYILERAEDSPGLLSYRTAYRGTNLEHADRGLENGKRYIYRLSKRRGSQIFGPSDEVLGVSSLITRDVYKNDTMEQALKLESIDYIANIYYYRSYGGLELIDEDWFYIDIPPMRQASVVVNDSKAMATDAPTHFEYYEYARNSDTVRQLRDFWIINNELETRRYYFKLYPAKSQFVSAGIPGGDIVQYRISLVSIVPIKIGG